MSVINKLLGLFVREQEKLGIFLQPKTAMIRGVDLNQFHSVYQPFVDKLEDVLNRTHRAQLHFMNESGSFGYDYIFSGKDVKAVYSVQPLAMGQDGPIMYIGELTVQQPEIDLEAAGRLINQTRHIGLITYSDKYGLLIRHSKGNQVLGRGKDLLTKLNVELEEVCKHFFVTGVVCWGAIDLKPKE
jgi:hypothetical protein